MLILSGKYVAGRQAFFSDWRTRQAIVDIAGAGSLTIYCGAGTTIDRTTLSWGDLVYRLLLRESTARSRITPDEVARLRRRLSPLELASIYEQYVLESLKASQKTTDAHVPRLQDMLYLNAGWESGVLVRNIVRLAVSLSVMGRSIKIVTSNYDTYIEQELHEYLSELAQGYKLNKAKIRPVPGYNVWCLGSKTPEDSVPPVGNAGEIDIIYLHGRIMPRGGLAGDLALAEGDYQRLRPNVSVELDRSFQGRDILILGSSLTDPPLLGALFDQRRKTRGKQPSRIALVPAASTGMVDFGQKKFPKLITHLQKRADQFGLKLLTPDFHFQIAQFCQEIVICASMGPRFKDYGNKNASCNMRYDTRLDSWWTRWVSKNASLATLTNRLSECIKKLEADPEWGSNPEETYKVELWVRHEPSAQRNLALWAASTGILKDRRALKYEPLGLDTNNASIRAFIEGKPFWLAKEDLDSIELRAQKREWIERIEGRWPRYLAVPIRLDETLNANIPVGVITLAAKGGTHTNVPINNVDAMDRVLSILRSAGRALLKA